VHDGSKCSDGGNDCCASESWGEPQTCRDGYVPQASSPEQCPSSYPQCREVQGGIGCYGCYPPPGLCKHADFGCSGVELAELCSAYTQRRGMSVYDVSVRERCANLMHGKRGTAASLVPADTPPTCPQIQMQRSLPAKSARPIWSTRRRVATSANPRLLSLPPFARSGSPMRSATSRRRRFPKPLKAIKELAHLVLLACLHHAEDITI
jgi:hypothetical protein